VEQQAQIRKITAVAPAEVQDNGKVRLGGWAPSLPPVRPAPKEVSDNGKVRLGGWAPSL
jgi:hypothetical protein